VQNKTMMEKNTFNELCAVIRNDLQRELRCKFPTYYEDIPDSFRNAVVRDVFEASAWQDLRTYNQDDINLAIQRALLAALQRNNKEANQ